MEALQPVDAAPALPAIAGTDGIEVVSKTAGSCRSEVRTELEVEQDSTRTRLVLNVAARAGARHGKRWRLRRRRVDIGKRTQDKRSELAELAPLTPLGPRLVLVVPAQSSCYTQHPVTTKKRATTLMAQPVYDGHPLQVYLERKRPPVACAARPSVLTCSARRIRRGRSVTGHFASIWS
jgi:hypothetical protein